MPLYDYLCEQCGPFSARVPMSHSGSPLACPDCSLPSPRTISAPQLNLMSPLRRRIDSRNEKSAHAPEFVHRSAHGDRGACAHRGGHSHAPGHSHGSRHSHGSAHSHAPARPWMVGH